MAAPAESTSVVLSTAQDPSITEPVNNSRTRPATNCEERVIEDQSNGLSDNEHQRGPMRAQGGTAEGSGIFLLPAS